jgi:hypothetical protein
MIDSKIKIYCTDNGKSLDTHILNYKPKVFLEVSLQTIKLRLVYKENTKAFVGSLDGKEFVFKEENLPQENRGYTR